MGTRLFDDFKIPYELVNEFFVESSDADRVPIKEPYHINIYGYGHLSQELVDQMAENIQYKDSNIHGITVWFRPKPGFDSAEAKREFNDRLFMVNTDEIIEKVNFSEIRSLKEAGDILVRTSEDHKEQGINDIILLLTSYGSLDNLIYTKGDNVLKYTEKTLKNKFSVDEIQNFIDTLVYEPSEQYMGEMLKLQDQRFVLEKVIGDLKHSPYRLDRDTMFRVKMLKNNLIGTSEFGKAVRGYKGSILNYVNDVELTTLALLSNSGLSYNRIWSPIDNDLIRLNNKIMDFVNKLKSTGEKKLIPKVKLKDVAIEILGSGHGPGFYIDPSAIKIMETPFSEFVEIDIEYHWPEIYNAVRLSGQKIAEREKRTARDNISAIMYQLKSILNNKFESTHRCIAYSPDFGVTIGQATKIKNNKLELSGEIDQQTAKMSTDTQEQMKKYISNNKLIVQALKEAGYLKDFKPEFEEVGEAKTRTGWKFVNIIDKLKKKIQKKRWHLHHYVLNPETSKSINSYDINGEQTIKNEIIFPITTRLAAITMISPHSDRILSLLERELRKDFQYTFYNVSKDSQYPDKIAEFISNKIISTCQSKEKLYVVEEIEGKSRLWSYNIFNFEKETYQNVPLSLSNILVINDIVYGLSDDKLVRWMNAESSPETLLTGTTGTFLQGQKYNGQTLLALSLDNKATVYNVQADDLIKFSSLTGKIGLFASSDGIKTVFASTDSRLELRKGYNISDLQNKGEIIDLNVRDRQILSGLITQINITENFAVVGGRNGQIIIESNPLMSTGKYINIGTSIFADLEKHSNG